MAIMGLLNCYGGAIELLYLWPCRKNHPAVKGKKLHIKCNFLQELCIKCFLKHNYSTQMGIPDILNQHYFKQEYPFKIRPQLSESDTSSAMPASNRSAPVTLFPSSSRWLSIMPELTEAPALTWWSLQPNFWTGERLYDKRCDFSGPLSALLPRQYLCCRQSEVTQKLPTILNVVIYRVQMVI